MKGTQVKNKYNKERGREREREREQKGKYSIKG